MEKLFNKMLGNVSVTVNSWFIKTAEVSHFNCFFVIATVKYRNFFSLNRTLNIVISTYTLQKNIAAFIEAYKTPSLKTKNINNLMFRKFALLLNV